MPPGEATVAGGTVEGATTGANAGASPVVRGLPKGQPVSAESGTFAPATDAAPGKMQLSLPAPALKPHATGEGDFGYSKEAQERLILDLRTGGISTWRAKLGDVRFFTDRDLTVNLPALDHSSNLRMRSNGARQAHETLLLASGAGLGTRSGGMVRILQPDNSNEVYSEQQITDLSRASDILTGKSLGDVPANIIWASFVKGQKQLIVPGNLTDAQFAEAQKTWAQETTQTLHQQGREQPGAISGMHCKFIKAAMASARNGRYVRAAIWTSEPVHQAIREGVALFEKNFDKKPYSSNAKIHQVICESVERWLEASKKKSLTFGYQRGVHGFHPKGHPNEYQPEPSSPVLGEGAGSIIEALHESGFASELVAEGIKDVYFENGEVDSDLLKIYGAHLHSRHATGSGASIVVVPWRPGDQGGWPFKVKGRTIFLEDSMFPEGFKEIVEQQKLRGGNFFNSNTTILPLLSKYLGNVGWEPPKMGLLRPKLNMQNICFDVDVNTIGGSVPESYVHRKNARELVEGGPLVIATSRQMWALDAQHILDYGRKDYL